MKKKLFCTILILFWFSSIASPQNEIKNNFTIEEKIISLSTIWKEADENFPYFDRFSTNYWDSLYHLKLTEVLNSDNDIEFFGILETFINSLYDAHSKIIFSNDYPVIKNRNISKPDLCVTWLNDGYYVEFVSKELEKIIKPGAKILTINGIETEKYANQHLPLEVASKYPHVIRYYARWYLFNGPLGSVIKIKYLSLKGEISEIELVRKRNPDSERIYLNKKSLSLGEDNGLIFSINTENIGYFNLSGMITKETVDFFNSKIDSIRTCEGLIIDLRNSSGGSSYGNQIVDYFSKVESYQSFAMKVRINNSFYKALGAYSDKEIVKNIGGNPRHFEFQEYYKGHAFDSIIYNSQRNIAPITIPVVVLVNPTVSSATETMLISFINARAGVIIGQPTMGSCTQPLFIPLKNIGYFQVATQKPMYSDGTYFDYIHPDVLVNPTLKGYMEGRDEILEAGYKYFKNR